MRDLAINKDYLELLHENKQLLDKIQLLENKAKSLEYTLYNKYQDQDNPVQSEMRFREALGGVNLFGIAVERDGTISFCNEYCFRMTGWSKEELIGKNYFEVLVPHEDQESRRQEYAQALERQGYWNNSARSILTKSGEIRYINFTSVIINTFKGEIRGLTKIGEDVTEHRNVSLALKRSHEALQDLFDNSNDLIFICSTRGKFLFVNKSFKTRLGYDNDELQNLNIQDIILKKSKIAAYRNVLKIIKGEPIHKFKTILLSKKGKPIHLEGNINFRYEEGQPTALRGILYDITDKIRAEKAQTLYYSIGNLTAKSINLNQLYQTIHHELGKVIEVRNFYIKLYSDDKKEILFPYYVDEARDVNTKITKRKAGKGLTDYVMQRQRALFLYEDEIAELLQRDEIRLFGPLPKVWIGVPLKFENEVIGLISVKCYRSRNTYTTSDLELLDFISGQIALAIQRKKSEEKLRNQSAKLKAIFESSSHMMWTINRQNQLTSYNNNYLKSIEKQYGIQPRTNGSLLNLKLELEKSDLYEFWQEKYDNAFNGEMQHFELKDRLSDGRHRWREVYLNPILLGDGHIEEVSAIAHDITEKKLSEIALIESERKFRSIFESFQDVYYHANLDGIITLISPSVQEVLGYQPEEIIGRNIAHYLVSPQGKISVFIKRLLREKKIKNFESALKTKTGVFIQSIANIRVVYDERNQAMGIEGVLRDITELKKATEEVLRAKELAEKSLKVKESFLANMSHEIRTPMNGVIGMIDLMIDTPLNKEQYSYMGTIKKSSETLLNILNDILDLSKIEAGKMVLHQRSMNLRKTIEKVYTLFMQQASSKKNKLSYQIDPDIPPYLIADETRILQITSNLTSNAIKFTGNGAIKLRTRLENLTGTQCRIRIEVEDTGIGIDPENVKLLFNSFSQVDNSSSKSFSGTGLGLAISKELSRMMGGEIGVNSELGRGSIFWFTFLAQITDVPPQENDEDTMDFVSGDQFDERKPYILVVDDNSVNRKVAGEILQKAGCEVELATSGEDSILKISQKINGEKMYDLIFMDIQMPDMDGVEATQRIKSLRIPALPPIVAMTAYSMKEDREKFLAKGLDDYIPKPIKAQILINKVKELVFKAQLKEQNKAVYFNAVAQIETKNDLQKTEKNIPQVINQHTIAQLKKYGGTELVLQSLDEFLNDTETILKKSERALQKQNWKEMKNHLHTLKGNAGTLGVDAVAQWATQIEQNLKSEIIENIASDFIILKKNFQEFKDYYKLQVH